MGGNLGTSQMFWLGHGALTSSSRNAIGQRQRCRLAVSIIDIHVPARKPHLSLAADVRVCFPQATCAWLVQLFITELR